MLISSCVNGGEMGEELEANLSQATLSKINEKRIYFAHQSVGYNILDGISDLSLELKVKDLNKSYFSESSFFLHSIIGKNTKPLSKLKDYSNKLSNDLGDNIDIAILKLCYVDINRTTDIPELFKAYRETYNILNTRFPEVTFVHFTTPLTTRQRGLKTMIKRIIGKEIRGDKDNLNRQQFNELVRKNYDIVFDLAEIESTRPDGTRTTHTLEGQKYYSLFPEYSSDGGHLNENTSKNIAEKLLNFISEIE